VKTDIEFLKEFRGDLMDAAHREVTGRAAVPRSRPGLKVGVVLIAALVIVSGIVGYIATHSAGGGKALLARSGGKVLPGAAGSRREPDLVAPSATPADHSLTSGRRPAGMAMGPQVIKTARLYLRIPKDTFKSRFDQATRIAESYDGYVQSSSTSGTKLRSGGLLIRVPAANFERALTDLRALGRVQGQSVEGRDVSAQFVDLQARLRNARAEEEVLLKLLAKAPTVEASLRVQNTLSDVELQIEELQGQVRFLQHRAALSSIDVELSERARHHEKPPSHQTFGGAWRNALDGFFGVLTAVVVGLGYVVPITLLLVVAWLVFRRVRARVLA
jgi:uncharacterized protein DUF4349